MTAVRHDGPDSPRGLLLGAREPVQIPREAPPVLVVVVDTEEEFDWEAGFRREATSVTAMARIGLFQEVCDEYRVRPTYVVDYPVVTQEAGAAPIREFAKAGRAAIGAHLHPWVNPPHEEDVSRGNSYPGNLGKDLEARKLRELTDAIESSFGERPAVYKAGRYGVGPHTAAILEEAGYEVDLSVAPTMDYRADGGPDFSRFDARPWWFGRSRRLLEIPVAGAYVGYLRRLGGPLLRLATTQGLRWAKLSGILSRLRALQRLRLTPEGFSFTDNRRLTMSLLRSGQRVFQFSLHSPSMAPGHTSYVRDERGLRLLLDTCRRYFEFFLEELGGVAMAPLELKASLEA